MGSSRYYRPPSEEERAWNGVIFSFGFLLIISGLLIMMIKPYEQSSLISIIFLSVLWIISLSGFIVSIKSEYLTKEELKDVFNIETIFNPIVLIFGILFGFLGGSLFAGIFAALIGIKAFGIIFYFLWFIGFALIYAVIAINVSKS